MSSSWGRMSSCARVIGPRCLGRLAKHRLPHGRGSVRALNRDREGVPIKGVGRRKRLPHVGSLWSRRFRPPTRVINGAGDLVFLQPPATGPTC